MNRSLLSLAILLLSAVSIIDVRSSSCEDVKVIHQRDIPFTAKRSGEYVLCESVKWD